MVDKPRGTTTPGRFSARLPPTPGVSSGGAPPPPWGRGREQGVGSSLLPRTRPFGLVLCVGPVSAGIHPEIATEKIFYFNTNYALDSLPPTSCCTMWLTFEFASRLRSLLRLRVNVFAPEAVSGTLNFARVHGCI
ncbi:uncharacterized protein LOC110198335 [Phascolarctos cinereus]